MPASSAVVSKAVPLDAVTRAPHASAMASSPSATPRVSPTTRVSMPAPSAPNPIARTGRLVRSDAPEKLKPVAARIVAINGLTDVSSGRRLRPIATIAASQMPSFHDRPVTVLGREICVVSMPGVWFTGMPCEKSVDFWSTIIS
jgi:hypothetical protein